MRVRVYGEDSTARCCVLEEKVQRDTKRVRRRRKDRRKEEESLIERERERERDGCVCDDARRGGSIDSRAPRHEEENNSRKTAHSVHVIWAQRRRLS